MPAVELTMTVPGAVRIIAEFTASALSGGAVLGAGTVLDPEACQETFRPAWVATHTGRNPRANPAIGVMLHSRHLAKTDSIHTGNASCTSYAEFPRRRVAGTY